MDVRLFLLIHTYEGFRGMVSFRQKRIFNFFTFFICVVKIIIYNVLPFHHRRVTCR